MESQSPQNPDPNPEELSTDGSQAVDPQPVDDQGSSVGSLPHDLGAGVPVVQALVEAWSTESLDVSHFLSPLQQALSEQAFLRILRQGHQLRVDGRVLEDATGVVTQFAELLREDAISELLFKDGVDRQEVEDLLRILRDGGSENLGFDTLATRLWEADFQKIVYRCSDEVPSDHAREVEAFDLDNTRADDADDVASDPREDAVFSAVSAREDFPHLDIESLPIHLKHALFLSPIEDASTGSLRVEAPEESVNQLVYRLVDVYSSETDEELRTDVRQLLVNTIEALLREKKLAQVHELLLWLRSQAGGDSAWDELVQIVQQCICAPQTVMLLGNVLNDPEAHGKDVLAVRELLLVFDERTIDPLCVLLEKLESMEARKLVCQVLAVVAADDPEGLARRAEGQPWFVARNLAYVLGRIGGDLVLAFLRSWVLHRDDRVRVEVARALGKIEGSESTEILCGLLNDEEYRVRQSAVWALSNRRDPVALEHMRRLLFEDRDFRERRADERDDCFRTYGRLVSDGSFQELLDLAQQRQLLARGWKLELRRGAIIALGETGRSEARAVLQKLIKSRNAKLGEAARAALRDLRSQGKVQPGVRTAMESPRAHPDAGTVAWEEVGE